jgi:hypothetical protein
VWLIHSQILDELIIAGEMQESSKKSVLKIVSLPDHVSDVPGLTSRLLKQTLLKRVGTVSQSSSLQDFKGTDVLTRS